MRRFIERGCMRKSYFPICRRLFSAYLHRFDPSRQTNKKLHIEDMAWLWFRARKHVEITVSIFKQPE